MEKFNNLLTQITNIMEKDNRGVQIGCYSIAVIGLTIAIRRVRPFSRFKKPSDIPNHFIKERRELTGMVERVDPNGALLMIRHKPLVELPGIPSGELPVKISGVNVTGLGLSWLQSIVAGHEVKFVPVAKEKNFVRCEVLLPQTTRDKQVQILNVGESLVKVGFGQIIEDNPDILLKEYLNYQNRLKVAENYALKKKLGVKYYAKPTKSALMYVLKALKKLGNMTAKQISNVPKLVPS